MKLAKLQYASLCGVIDGALFVAGAFLFLLFFGDSGDFQTLFTSHWQYLVFGLLPFGLLIAGRGRADAQRLLAGNKSLLLAPAEGVGWSFGLSMLLWAVGYVNEVFAAGGIWDEVVSQPTNANAWWNVLSVLVPLSAIIGLIGAVTAFLIHWLNRFLVELWEAKTLQLTSDSTTALVPSGTVRK